MRTAICLPACLLLAGCAMSTASPQPAPPPPGTTNPAAAGLHFFVEPEVAAAGSEVTLVLDNRTAAPISYNLCSSGLEHWDGGSWQAVPDTGMCTRELRIVMPGQQARYEKELPSPLAAGNYRYRTGVERQAANPGFETLFSRPFAVGR